MGKSAAPVVACVAAALLCPLAVEAQGFGQWYWDAEVEARLRAVENTRNESNTTGYKSTDIKLGLGVNGYILHPAVAKFRVDVDALLSNTGRNGAGGSNKLWGLGGDIEILPRGTYRSRVRYMRRSFLLGDFVDRDPRTLLGIADTLTDFGADFRAIQGPARGLLASFNSSTTAFVLDERGERRIDRAVVDWNRASKDFRHRYRLERRSQEYPAFGSSSSQLLLSGQEIGKISRNWQWQLYALGQLIESGTGAIGKVGRDSFRVRNEFSRRVRGDRDFLRLSYLWGTLRATEREVVGKGQTHDLDARYNWILGRGLNLTPSASYNVQTSAGVTSRTARADTTLGWQFGGTDWGSSVAARIGVGSFSLTQGDASRSEPFVSGGVTWALTHGTFADLRKNLELEWRRNEQVLFNRSFFDLPDLGVSVAGSGIENRVRVRAGLAHRWGTLALTGSGEYAQSDFVGNLVQPDLRTERSLLTVRLDAPGSAVNLVVNAGSTTATSSLREQTDRFVAAGISYKPWRPLLLRGSYRMSFREVVLEPNIDVKRAELGAELLLGLLRVRLRAHTSRNRSVDGFERRNTGLFFSVVRDFFGLLPVFTGTRPRGVVR